MAHIVSNISGKIWAFCKFSLLSKNCCGYSLVYFGVKIATFMATSGHTGSGRSSQCFGGFGTCRLSCIVTVNVFKDKLFEQLDTQNVTHPNIYPKTSVMDSKHDQEEGCKMKPMSSTKMPHSADLKCRNVIRNKQ